MSITVPALTAGAQTIVTIADDEKGHANFGGRLPDVVVVNPAATPEVGFAIRYAWVSAQGVISVAISNESGTTLTGGTLPVSIAVIR